MSDSTAQGTSNAPADRSFSREERLRLAAGELAAGVSRELVRPLRELREDLAVLVEWLDRHISAAQGPRPLPWKELDQLRQKLMENYLRSRKLARLASELADAVGASPVAPQQVDVNKLVEAALNLVRHRIPTDTEVFIDFGSAPPLRAIAGELVLACATMISAAAASAIGADGSAISIRTRTVKEEGDDVGWVGIAVADNGKGLADGGARVAALVEQVAARIGGAFAGHSEIDKGSAFELRIPAS